MMSPRYRTIQESHGCLGIPHACQMPHYIGPISSAQKSQISIPTSNLCATIDQVRMALGNRNGIACVITNGSNQVDTPCPCGKTLLCVGYAPSVYRRRRITVLLSACGLSSWSCSLVGLPTSPHPCGRTTSNQYGQSQRNRMNTPRLALPELHRRQYRSNGFSLTISPSRMDCHTRSSTTYCKTARGFSGSPRKMG